MDADAVLIMDNLVWLGIVFFFSHVVSTLLAKKDKPMLRALVAANMAVSFVWLLLQVGVQGLIALVVGLLAASLLTRLLFSRFVDGKAR